MNFAYGYGPFLRTTELALAVSDLLPRQGEPLGVIVPWAYGQAQKRIMAEEFRERLSERSDVIFLDRTLGQCLQEIFYGEKSYEQSLRFYLENHGEVRRRIRDYIQKGLTVENFSGQPRSVAIEEIAMCVSRAPRLSYGLPFSYNAGFGQVSEILERSLPIGEIAVDKNLVEQIIPLYEEAEKSHRLHFTAEPSAFSHIPNHKPKYDNEIFTPPNALLPVVPDCMDIKPGMYVAVTGIPGLENLFAEAGELGLKIYTNQPDKIVGSERALPAAVACPAIALQFARSGWGSAWLSLLLGKPFITPPYDSKDDPEIYFNNQCLEELGIGKVYHGQPLSQLIAWADECRRNCEGLKQRLISKYGTLDGVAYAAERIAKDFLAATKPAFL